MLDNVMYIHYIRAACHYNTINYIVGSNLQQLSTNHCAFKFGVSHVDMWNVCVNGFTDLLQHDAAFAVAVQENELPVANA